MDTEAIQAQSLSPAQAIGSFSSHVARCDDRPHFFTHMLAPPRGSNGWVFAIH